MRIKVDRDVCDLHGQCVITAPELFRFDEKGELEYDEEAGEDLRVEAETAASVCPTGAIEIDP